MSLCKYLGLSWGQVCIITYRSCWEIHLIQSHIYSVFNLMTMGCCFLYYPFIYFEESLRAWPLQLLLALYLAASNTCFRHRNADTPPYSHKRADKTVHNRLTKKVTFPQLLVEKQISTVRPMTCMAYFPKVTLYCALPFGCGNRQLFVNMSTIVDWLSVVIKLSHCKL